MKARALLIALLVAALPLAATAIELKPVQPRVNPADAAELASGASSFDKDAEYLSERHDPYDAEAVRAAWPGPDGFGYSGFGCTINWIDITTTGTAVTGLTDDSSAGPFPLGFSFSFYGAAYTDFYISSNGFLSFGGGSSTLTNQCPLPSSTTPNNLIAVMWDDLYPSYSAGGGVFYEYFATCPIGTGQCTVVEYYNWAHCCTATTVAGTFEAVIFDDGTVMIQVLDGGTEEGLSSTTGIEGNDAANDHGLAYACNTAASIPDNTCASFAAIPTPSFGASYKAAPGDAEVGTDYTYTVYVANSGTDDATGVAMTDPIPMGTTYVSGSVACSAGTCDYDAMADEVYWNGDLLMGDAVTVTFDVTMGDVCGQTVVNTAFIDHVSQPVPVELNAYTLAWGLQPYWSDFEADNGGLVPDAALPGEWEWGVPLYPTGATAHSGVNVWATDLDGDANDAVGNHILNLVVTLPPDPLGTGVFLSFWDYWDDEASDYRLIRINGVDEYQLPTGDQLYWQQWQADLSAWAGQTVTIGFNLEVCCAAPGPHWTIDDVVITACALEPGIFVAPSIQGRTGCTGTPQPFAVSIYNNTGSDTIFDVAYDVTTGNGTATGPALIPVRQAESEILDFTVEGNLCLPTGTMVSTTVDVSGNGYADSAVAELTTDAGLTLPWVPMAPTPQGNRYGAVILHGTDIYQIGGETGWWTATDIVNVYDTLTNSWTATATNIPALVYGMDGVSAAGKVWIFGGNTGTGDPHGTPTLATVVGTVWAYDPVAGTWDTSYDPVPTPVAYYSAVFDGTYAYVIGGMDATGAAVNLVQVFDPTQAAGSQWSVGPAMSAVRIYPAAEYYDGMIYVAGGYQGGTVTVDTAEVLDITAGTWSALPALPKLWAPYGDAMLGDKFLVFNGDVVSNDGVNTTYTCSQDAYWLDTANPVAWEAITPLSRCYYGAEGVGDGVGVYLVSGRTNDGGWRMATEVEYYEACPSCPFADGTVTGNVLYAPAVTDMSGTAIEAYETGGGTMVGSTATDAMGHYSLTLPADNYDVVATRADFLWGVYNTNVVAGSTVTLPDVTPWGGDMNTDDTINIVDISFIATNFGTAGPAGDLNGDGAVNITDISGAAVHFGEVAPVPW